MNYVLRAVIRKARTYYILIIDLKFHPRISFFPLLLLPICFNFKIFLNSIFAFLNKKKTDFLRHAPCMRHVKKDYEVCSSRYQNTMSKIAQSNITPDPDNKTQQEFDEAIKIKTVCW